MIVTSQAFQCCSQRPNINLLNKSPKYVINNRIYPLLWVFAINVSWLTCFPLCCFSKPGWFCTLVVFVRPSCRCCSHSRSSERNKPLHFRSTDKSSNLSQISNKWQKPVKMNEFKMMNSWSTPVFLIITIMFLLLGYYLSGLNLNVLLDPHYSS